MSGRIATSRPPILGPPPRDDSGRFIEENGSLTLKTTIEDKGEELKRRAREAVQRRYLASNSIAETAADARMKQMEIQMTKMEQLVEENSRLNSLIHQLLKNQGTGGTIVHGISPTFSEQGIQAALTIPREQIGEICEVPQVSNVMVEWSSPSRERRRSKKTPLQAEMPNRTPPRPPNGTPQTKKKARVSASPAANRYEVLAEEIIDDIPDEEMDEDTDECLADVEDRLDKLKIRNTHVELDSIKKNGAGGQE